jgi:hypothetical protein
VALSAVARNPAVIEDALCELLLDRKITAKMTFTSVAVASGTVPIASKATKIPILNPLNVSAGTSPLSLLLSAVMRAQLFCVCRSRNKCQRNRHTRPPCAKPVRYAGGAVSQGLHYDVPTNGTRGTDPIEGRARISLPLQAS